MSGWENNIRKAVPYTPGEQPKEPNMIKLNTNENPYPPAPGVAKVLKEYASEHLRLYPDPAVSKLVEAIASYHQVGIDQVFAGVGSDDVLAMSFMTFFNSHKPILFPDITYSFYDVWADLLKIPYETIPLDDSFSIRPHDYFRENGGIIFPNPNAPTGILVDLPDIEQILQKNRDVIVIIDEAYIDFGGKTALPLVEKYDNLLVVRTFSKSRSMAGSRIGYGIGNPQLIQYLNDVKYSFNSYTMDSVTIECGVASIADEVYFRSTCDKIMETRQYVQEELKALGFSFHDSMSNFIFATHRKVPAKDIFQALRKENIYVRYFPKPRIDNYLRITIGTREEMDTLLSFLNRYLNEK